MMRLFTRLCLMSGLISITSTACFAQANHFIPFQAQLTTATGQPITNPSQTITVSLYSGGNVAYTETKNVSVVGGKFSTFIGEVNPSAFAQLSFNTPYAIGVKAGSDPEMTPRLPLASVPYARSARSLAPGSLVDGLRIGMNNVLEFGAGIPGKESFAGMIGYGSFTSNTLDIVGAGSVPSQRRVKIHAEGGTSISGGLGVAGPTYLGGNVNVVGWFGIGDISAQAPLHVKGNANLLVLEGADHSYISFHPYGYFAGRQAYLGFPSGGSNQLVIANESGGPVRVVGPFINDSDARNKTNIAPLTNSLDAVLKLQGVTFDWRDASQSRNPDRQRQIGFLAQDVENILPDLVYSDRNGTKSVAYISVVPLLVEAIKDQQREIVTLRAEVARAWQLENRLSHLEQQLLDAPLK